MTALYALSFIDRLIIALLADPISHDLGVSDWQIGLLAGAGFAVVYTLTGLPIAHWIDHGNRRKIVAGGSLLWSSMTILSAFADSFLQLALARAGVAIGEAVLVPAAISLIADLFPSEKRALPVSVFAAMAGTMGYGSFIVNGAAFDLAKVVSSSLGLVPWRITFLIIGCPGILLSALMLFTVREPERRTSGSQAAERVSTRAREHASTRAFLSFLNEKRYFFIPYFIGIALTSSVSYAKLTWTPTLAMRAHGMTPGAAGYAIGVAGIVVGLAGAFGWPWFAAKLEKRGRSEGRLLCFMIGTAITLPIIMVAPLSPTVALLIAGISLATIGLSPAGVLNPLVMQAAGPPRMHARLMAMSQLSINLVGLSLGPIMVPTLAAAWPDDPMALGYGLAISGALAITAAGLLFWQSRRALSRGPIA